MIMKSESGEIIAKSLNLYFLISLDILNSASSKSEEEYM